MKALIKLINKIPSEIKSNEVIPRTYLKVMITSSKERLKKYLNDRDEENLCQYQI